MLKTYAYFSRKDAHLHLSYNNEANHYKQSLHGINENIQIEFYNIHN